MYRLEILPAVVHEHIEGVVFKLCRHTVAATTRNQLVRPFLIVRELFANRKVVKVRLVCLTVFLAGTLMYFSDTVAQGIEMQHPLFCFGDEELVVVQELHEVFLIVF